MMKPYRCRVRFLSAVFTTQCLAMRQAPREQLASCSALPLIPKRCSAFRRPFRKSDSVLDGPLAGSADRLRSVFPTFLPLPLPWVFPLLGLLQAGIRQLGACSAVSPNAFSHVPSIPLRSSHLLRAPQHWP